MSRVFVVCEPLGKFDRSTGEHRRGTDVSPAEAFGPIGYLVSSRGPHGSLPDDPNEVAAMLQERLDEVAFKDEDYLILLDDMIACAIAVSLAADACAGSVRLLRWNGPTASYMPVTLHLWTQEPASIDALTYTKDRI